MIHEYISIPTDSKLILLNEVKKGERVLLIYGSEVKRAHSYLSFIRNGLSNNELCIYIHPPDRAGLSLENIYHSQIKNLQLYLIPLYENENFEKSYRNTNNRRSTKNRKQESPDLLKTIEYLDNKLIDFLKNYTTVSKNSEKTYSNIRMLVDFNGIETKLGMENITNWTNTFKKNITKHFKKSEIIHELFEHVTFLCSVNIQSTDFNNEDNHLNIFDKIIVSTQNDSSIQIPNLTATEDIYDNLLPRNTRTTSKNIFDKSLQNIQKSQNPRHIQFEFLNQRTVNQFVKNSLELIILSLIRNGEMCGYDIVKTIRQQFNIHINHSMVYPILYSLKDEGILQTSEGDNKRTRVYSPTEKGISEIESRLNEYETCYGYLINLINNSTQLNIHNEY